MSNSYENKDKKLLNDIASFLNESSQAYGQAADDIKKKNISDSDKNKINKIADMMNAEKKKKLDPVGKEDEDVDNDGDTDASDSYLKNRRAARTAAIKESFGEDFANELDEETIDTLNIFEMTDDDIQKIIDMDEDAFEALVSVTEEEIVLFLTMSDKEINALHERALEEGIESSFTKINEDGINFIRGMFFEAVRKVNEEIVKPGTPEWDRAQNAKRAERVRANARQTEFEKNEFRSRRKQTPATVKTGSRIGRFVKGTVPGIVGGLALDYGSQKAGEAGYKKTAAGLDIASDALTGASIGGAAGSVVPVVGTTVGAAVGAAGGAGYGLYKHGRELFGGRGGSTPSHSDIAKAQTFTAPQKPATLQQAAADLKKPKPVLPGQAAANFKDSNTPVPPKVVGAPAAPKAAAPTRSALKAPKVANPSAPKAAAAPATSKALSPFGKAFRSARDVAKGPGGSFEFGGKTFNTSFKGEKVPSKLTPVGRPAETPKTLETPKPAEAPKPEASMGQTVASVQSELDKVPAAAKATERALRRTASVEKGYTSRERQFGKAYADTWKAEKAADIKGDLLKKTKGSESDEFRKARGERTAARMARDTEYRKAVGEEIAHPQMDHYTNAISIMEAKRGRPRKNPEPTKTPEEEMNEPRQHIIQQLQRAKLSMRGGEKVTFKNGESHEVHGSHAANLLSKYAGMKPHEKEAFQKKISASHENLKSEL